MSTQELSGWLSLALDPAAPRGAAVRLECFVGDTLVHAVTFGANGAPPSEELAGLLLARLAAEGAEAADVVARFAGPSHEPITLSLSD